VLEGASLPSTPAAKVRGQPDLRHHQAKAAPAFLPLESWAPRTQTGARPIFAATTKQRLPQLSFLWKAGHHEPKRGPDRSSPPPPSKGCPSFPSFGKLGTTNPTGDGPILPAPPGKGCPSFPSFGKLGTTNPNGGQTDLRRHHQAKAAPAFLPLESWAPRTQPLHVRPSSEPSSPLSVPRSPVRSHALPPHSADNCSRPIVAAPAPAHASQDCDACIATSPHAFSR
jgi:hypothetical protein